MCKNLLQGVRTMLRRNTPQRTRLRGTYYVRAGHNPSIEFEIGKIREDREFWNFLSHYLV